MTQSLTARLVAAFGLLLLAFGLLVAFLGHWLTLSHERETLQRLSYGLAQHIVEHWPEVTQPASGTTDRESQDRVLQMLMTVNPAIDVYMLDAEGRVRAYLGDPGAVRDPQVDIDAVRAFIAGAPLPLLGSDPKAPRDRKIFSAAMFPPAAGIPGPPGYLYVVLAGEARAQAESRVGVRRVWLSAALAALSGLMLTFSIGVFTFRRITAPLRRLADGIRAFRVGEGLPTVAGEADAGGPDDEIEAITRSFDAMAARIDHQARERARQEAEHRETIANVAHDLRSPLTALHGYLEVLGGSTAGTSPEARQRYLRAAIVQSEKVGRLVHQLFELARLQSSGDVLQRDRVRIDELVHDTVQKFELLRHPHPVTLSGRPPGRIEIDADVQLLDRALTNLIDNAIRHGGHGEPVRVTVERREHTVAVLVQDAGPGMPSELTQRLDSDKPVRDPPPARPGGGLGGLGLAIAQRIAWLHGGNLRTLAGSGGGTCVCLELPLEPESSAPG